MAYQRTEYADKTISMNSLADRKLRIKLGSLEFHKETIEKEMKRERKKLERELGGMDEQFRNRLTVSEMADSYRSLSPRLPRRFSTPPELLSATLPPALTDHRKSPLAARRRLGSDQGLADPLRSDSSSPTLLPPNSMFLKAPFDQPRRQSLPPIGDGGLLSAENNSRRDRRGSYCGGHRSPGVPTPTSSGPSSPRSLSRKGSSLNENEMSEVTAKVTRFLQKINNKAEQNEQKKRSENIVIEYEQNENEEEFDRCHQEALMPVKNQSQGIFHPLNFE